MQSANAFSRWMDDLSPAVERALAAAEIRAEGQTLHTAHLLLALLEDEEARPAQILQHWGVTLHQFRQSLTALDRPAPPIHQLLTRAREWSLERRADPHILSDALFFALLQEDAEALTLLQSLGVSPTRLQADLALAIDPGEPTSAEPFPSGNHLAPEARPGGDSLPAPDHQSEPVGEITPKTRPITQDVNQFLATHIELETDAFHPHAADPSSTLSVANELGLLTALRVVDANLNRAAEAFRVMDDYCRFVLNDALLTEEFKTLRHQLAEIASQLPLTSRLAARDTTHDVGTAITTASESRRPDLRHLARVNLKRLQEALRSLEEYGKIFDPRWGERVEHLRYRSYTLERAVLRGEDSRQRLATARLYVLVSPTQCCRGMEQTVRGALAGGADVIQLREKQASDRRIRDLAWQIRRWTRDAGALFIVNDRPDIARLVEADGVHLGQEDLPVHEARKILPPEAIVGVSTHDIGQLRQAILDGADYVGLGPVFPSHTKAFAEFPGLAYVNQAMQRTTLPAFALGGITPDNLPEVIQAGARRVAVAAAITQAADPEHAARRFKRALDERISSLENR